MFWHFHISKGTGNSYGIVEILLSFLGAEPRAGGDFEICLEQEPKNKKRHRTGSRAYIKVGSDADSFLWLPKLLFTYHRYILYCRYPVPVLVFKKVRVPVMFSSLAHAVGVRELEPLPKQVGSGFWQKRITGKTPIPAPKLLPGLRSRHILAAPAPGPRKQVTPAPTTRIRLHYT